MIAEFVCSIMLTAAIADHGTTVATDSIGRAPSDSHCAVELSADWPRDGQQPLTDSLRAYITAELAAFYMPNPDGATTDHPAYKGDTADGKAVIDYYAESILEDMQAAYRLWTRETGDTSMYMIDQSSVRKTSENDSIVTYEASCYIFQGGAHGSNWIEGATFSKSDGHRIIIDLDPLEIDGMQPLLREGFNKYLKDNGQTITVDDIINDGMFLTDGVIPLPSSPPFLTTEGVKFVYQQYEIGPYALGLPTFTIPLDKLKPFFGLRIED